MKLDLREWTADDLREVCALGLEEGQGLEFKGSDALANTSANKREIAKDVSAMANAAGGRIIYGIVENDGRAESVDAGSTTPPEWLDQVISQNIEPKIAGLFIQPVQLATRRGYVVDIPQATTLAPHQNRADQRYYRRHNTTVLPMMDHEVRDLMGRARAPELYLEFQTLPHATREELIRLIVTYRNRSPEPAHFSIVQIMSGAPIIGLDNARWDKRDTTVQGIKVMLYTRSFAAVGDVPIFREAPYVFIDEAVHLAEGRKPFGYRVSTSGYTFSESGVIHREGIHGTSGVMMDPSWDFFAAS